MSQRTVESDVMLLESSFLSSKHLLLDDHKLKEYEQTLNVLGADHHFNSSHKADRFFGEKALLCSGTSKGREENNTSFETLAFNHERDFSDKMELEKPIIDVMGKRQSNNVPWNKICSILNTCRDLKRKPGVHSVVYLRAAGFEYINEGDTAYCSKCHLSVRDWTKDMIPFRVHAELKPHCEFVQAMISSINSISSYTYDKAITHSEQHFLDYNAHEHCVKRQKLEDDDKYTSLPCFVEVDLMKTIRHRTFSHFHKNSPLSAQMISAGFFSCNVGDRVICIYCNLICQQWMPHSDDPCEVHRVLSPHCPFVRSMLAYNKTVPLHIINQSTITNETQANSTADIIRNSEIVPVSAVHVNYIELPKRQASFSNWSNESFPSSEDLVRAGFFYSGTNTVVTCFYCGCSLQNWGPNDNPMIEHARWFPQCSYAKQLCGDDLYRRIQESKRALEERNKSKDQPRSTTNNSQKLIISDESTLSRLVAARLDLSISQDLIRSGVKSSIVKRCWEDQLRLKLDDFITECDLQMACVILEKQISGINGKKENIIIPNVKMEQLRKQSSETSISQTSQSSSAIASTSSTSKIAKLEVVTKLHSITKETTSKESGGCNPEQNKPLKQSSTSEKLNNKQMQDTTSLSPCALCLTEDRNLACLPCGHLATCVPCGHSLRACAICRQKIDGFIRIYT